MSTYAGIDYSLGGANRNHETGIHYGVISQHSITGEALSDLEDSYPECENPECEELGFCECEFESIGMTYDRDGYKIEDCLDFDLMVLESPYFTYCQYCSPCVPGAGNLDEPMEGGIKTYCLGKDWFDKYNPCPYEHIYFVATGEEVTE